MNMEDGGVGSIQCNGMNSQDEAQTVPLLQHKQDIIDIARRNKHKRGEHSTTELETFIHLIKGNLGTGLLALPSAVKNAGLIVGSVGLLLMGIIAAHCMGLLVSTSHKLRKKHDLVSLNYAEVAYMAVQEHASRYAKIAFHVVNFFLVITQFGFCTIYLVFIGKSLEQVACSAFGLQLDIHWWIAIILPLVIVCCWIRDWDDLASFSMIGNLCIVFSLVVIVGEEIHRLVSNNPADMAAIKSNATNVTVNFGPKPALGLALYFGSVVYAFEGIGVVLPLENRMKKPQNAIRMVYSAMAVTIALYTCFGALGYLVYGADIKSSITLNLYSSIIWLSILFLIVKLYYAYAIFATYMVQFYVPMDFLEPPLIETLHRLFPHHYARIQFPVQIIFRTFVVAVTAGIALAVPDLGDLITLVGAVASSALALMFPPLFDILTFWKEKRDRKLLWMLVWLIKNILIIVLGVVGSIFGTGAAIKNIVDFFRPENNSPNQECPIVF